MWVVGGCQQSPDFLAFSCHFLSTKHKNNKHQQEYKHKPSNPFSTNPENSNPNKGTKHKPKSDPTHPSYLARAFDLWSLAEEEKKEISIVGDSKSWASSDVICCYIYYYFFKFFLIHVLWNIQISLLLFSFYK